MLTENEHYKEWQKNPTPENLEKLTDSFDEIITPKVKINFDSKEGKLICSFDGEMDTITSSSLENELTEKLEAIDAPVVFEFTKLTYLASGFLRICLKIAQSKGEGNFEILNVNPNIKKVLKVAGFYKIISISG